MRQLLQGLRRRILVVDERVEDELVLELVAGEIGLAVEPLDVLVLVLRQRIIERRQDPVVAARLDVDDVQAVAVGIDEDQVRAAAGGVDFLGGLEIGGADPVKGGVAGSNRFRSDRLVSFGAAPSAAGGVFAVDGRVHREKLARFLGGRFRAIQLHPRRTARRHSDPGAGGQDRELHGKPHSHTSLKVQASMGC